MAIQHALPGEIMSVDVDPSAENVNGTRALFKTAHMEVLRFILPQGKTIPQHQAPSEIIVQCLAGQVNFTAMGQTIELKAGQMFYLAAGEPHDVHAPEDCRFLLTLLLPPKIDVDSPV